MKNYENKYKTERKKSLKTFTLPGLVEREMRLASIYRMSAPFIQSAQRSVLVQAAGAVTTASAVVIAASGVAAAV